jgi:hypothetical protein
MHRVVVTGDAGEALDIFIGEAMREGEAIPSKIAAD